MNAERHRVTGTCQAVHCFTHDADEDPDSAYRVCFECGHAYPDADALRREWQDCAPPELRGRPAPAAEEIAFCPLCAHDW